MRDTVDYVMFFFFGSIFVGVIFVIGASVYCSEPAKWRDSNSRCYSAEAIKKEKCNENPELAYCRSIFTEEKK